VAPGVAVADTTPPPGTPATVSADPLPTVQVNGVVWTQAVSGNVVYAGGKFTTARPAGAAPGTSTVTRNNLLAYDIRTGALISSFTPDLNSDVRGLTVSPDGTRLYVVGQFTTANGQTRSRIAAYDTATGALVSSFRPLLDTTANAVVATNDTVYLGGIFTAVNGVARSRLAAVRATDGALLAWAPTADMRVNAMVMADGGRKIIAGGGFSTMNGASALGLAALDPTTGASLPWNAGKVVQAYGENLNGAGTGAAFNSLSTDGTNVYGTAFNYYGNGNLEGTFAARADTGDIAWIEDCHGDTYGAYAQGGAVYTVSHAHNCQNMVDGFPETTPRTHHHSLAFTAAPVNKLKANTSGGYGNLGGQPAPALLRWFPDLGIGTATGQKQAGWTVTGNSDYVVMGGEFPNVNGIAQQGLVRFAKTPVAPGKSGPVLSAGRQAPAVASVAPGTVRVSFQANWDRDNETLTYNVYRDGATTPAYTTSAPSTFWSRPTLGFVDRDLALGSRHRYRVSATDPHGNTVTSGDVYVTVSSDTGAKPYADAVLRDGAGSYWRLGEGSGSLAYDYAGFSNLTLTGGITRGATGALTDDAATSFDGLTKSTTSGTTVTTTTTNGFTASPVNAPSTFTMEAWVRTTSTAGGKIIGFGNVQGGGASQPGNSTTYDRHLYMDNAGRVFFGVYKGGTQVLSTSGAYNDGQWHQVVGQMSPAGMVLYVDGVRVGRNAGVTSGDPAVGYWRVGGDNLNGWPSTPTSNYLNGSIDDVAVYPSALTTTQVRDHFTLSGRTPAGAVRPTDAYGQKVYDSAPESYWRLDETTGTTAADSSPNSSGATYVTGVTQGAAGALPQGTAAAFNGSNGLVVGSEQVANPRTYSQELWFNTATTRGGKLIGFGSATTGNSPNYDRHVYMLDNGRLRFGVWTGQTNLIDSARSYNDGTWHHMVATQSTTDGMKLYVDGALVGTNPQTGAQAYNGYWRIGGDNTWGGAASNYFAGSIDEVAVYASALSATDVVAHYKAGGGQLPNQAPTASFTATASGLSAALDASASTDSDGTLASYAWDFGDATTGTGVKPTHAYAAAGTYTVRLTVTDDRGLTATTTRTVTVVKANQAPVAAFTAATANLAATFDGSTSSDPDGTIASHAWDFGDATTGTGATATHTYTQGGTFQVTLTVTDDKGLTSSVTRPVTVARANVAPTAAFTSTTSGLTASVDGTTSTDSDGTVSSHAWAFGDGTTGTGATTSRSYAAAGTYQVTLTVTDDKGATASTTRAVTVTAPVTPPAATTYATDAFERAVTGGLGTADTGGAWSLAGRTTSYAVNGGLGRITAPTAGATSSAFLNAVSSAQTDALVDLSLDKAQTGGGTYVSVVGRRVDAANDYRGKLRLTADGKVSASVTRTVAGSEVTVTSVVVPNLTYAAGGVLRVRTQVTGTNPTTVRVRVWPAGTTEPTSWAVSATDATAALQAPGSFGLVAYLSGSATNAPMTASFDNLTVGPPAGG
jgi:PKD repeat protein